MQNKFGINDLNFSNPDSCDLLITRKISKIIFILLNLKCVKYSPKI